MSNESKIEVLKAGDMEGMIAYATGKPRASAPPAQTESSETASAEKAPAPSAVEPEEDENGLTEADRKELTQRHQRAMGRKHRQYKDADERAIRYHAEALAEKQAREAVERKLAELEASRTPAEKPKTAAEEDAEPVWQDGMDPEKYRKDWGAWNRREAVREFRADEAKRQAAEREATALKTAQERLARAQEMQPDWAEAIGAVSTPIPPAVGAYMHESEMIGEIAYYFAKHPAELESLGKLTPTQQLVAIGKIEAKLSPFVKASATAKADPPTAKAPPAPKPSTTAPAPRQPPEVPILSQVPSGTSDSQVEGRGNTADAIAKFERENGVNLSRRRRN